MLRFAVCTFDRVFDTQPKQETLSLPELVRGLLRFELKPQLAQSVQRNERKLEQVWASWEAGEYRSGKQYGALLEAARKAEQEHGDREAAVEAAYARLLTEARGAPKRDLRLWSPALYRPGSKRGGDEVQHLSCLVLDYDKALPFEAAQAPWRPWFHVAHSTWSHQEGRPKFRIVLPLAAPVLAEDWAEVWPWADRLADGWLDPAMKGRGATFALAATPGREADRIATVHDDAPLLDLMEEGVVRRAAPAPPLVSTLNRPTSHFSGGVAGHEYLELAPAQLRLPPEPAEEDWDALFEEL